MSKEQKTQKERKNKTLQELTFKNNFMFAAVMMDEANAKAVLERILGIKVKRLKVFYEKSIVYNPEYKGIRLDVEIEDENHTHYDVEMQVANSEIKRRARYYHDQVDMELLLSGEEYENLPDVYVIFICDFDPIGLGKYKYTRIQTFLEDKSYDYQDGCHTVFLSTKGQNDCEESKELVKFLKFVGANLEESKRDYEDELVKRLQESVEKVKSDREMGRRYMTLEELMKDEFKAGKEAGLAEGKEVGLVEGEISGMLKCILELLSEAGTVSENLKERVSSVTETEILSGLLVKASKAESVEEFETYLDELNL